MQTCERARVSTYKTPTFHVRQLDTSSHSSTPDTTVRHELEPKNSKPTGLSIEDSWFPHALHVDRAILCNASLSCQRSCLSTVKLLFHILDSLLFHNSSRDRPPHHSLHVRACLPLRHPECSEIAERRGLPCSAKARSLLWKRIPFTNRSQGQSGRVSDAVKPRSTACTVAVSTFELEITQRKFVSVPP